MICQNNPVFTPVLPLHSCQEHLNSATKFKQMSRLLQFHGPLLAPVQAITSSQGVWTKGAVAHLNSNIYCWEYAVLHTPAEGGVAARLPRSLSSWQCSSTVGKWMSNASVTGVESAQRVQWKVLQQMPLSFCFCLFTGNRETLPLFLCPRISEESGCKLPVELYCRVSWAIQSFFFFFNIKLYNFQP